MHTGYTYKLKRKKIVACFPTEVHTQLTFRNTWAGSLNMLCQEQWQITVEDPVGEGRGMITEQHKHREKERKQRTVVLDVMGIHAQISVSDKFILI